VTRDDKVAKNLEEIRQIHLNLGYRDIGYHYVVEMIGKKPELKVGRPNTEPGAHCLPDIKPYANTYMNYYWIGLCIIGDFSNEPPSPTIIVKVAEAIKEIARKCGFKVNCRTVIGHRDASYTVCPGKYTMSNIYEELGI
jgi:hypothetical protein